MKIAFSVVRGRDNPHQIACDRLGSWLQTQGHTVLYGFYPHPVDVAIAVSDSVYGELPGGSWPQDSLRIHRFSGLHRKWLPDGKPTPRFMSQKVEQLYYSADLIVYHTNHSKMMAWSFWEGAYRDGVCLPHGIDESFCPPPEKPWVLFAAGHWSHYRRLREVLDSFFILRNKGVDVTLRLAGTLTDQSYNVKLDDVMNIPGVTWLGKLRNPQVMEEIKRSHVVINPCWMQHSSTLALEAASVGRPVIVSEQSGAPEFAGSAGYVLKEDNTDQWSYYGPFGSELDPRKITTAITDILSDYDEWVERAKKRSVEVNIETVGPQWMNIINEGLTRKGCQQSPWTQTRPE